MTSIRPDIAFAISKLSQFSHNLCIRHWVVLNQVIRYLRGTLRLGLVYGGSRIKINPIGYANAIYADFLDKQKSIYDIVLLLENLAYIWTSTK